MSRPIDAVLSRLEQFKLRENGRDRWRACCPAHGGSNASALSIGIGQNDAVLLRCWQGCGIDEVAGDDEVNVKFGATIDGLKSKMAEAGVSIKEFAKGAGEQIETLNRSIAGIRGAFASIAELATLGFIGEQALDESAPSTLMLQASGHATEAILDAERFFQRQVLEWMRRAVYAWIELWHAQNDEGA